MTVHKGGRGVAGIGCEDAQNLKPGALGFAACKRDFEAAGGLFEPEISKDCGTDLYYCMKLKYLPGILSVANFYHSVGNPTFLFESSFRFCLTSVLRNQQVGLFPERECTCTVPSSIFERNKDSCRHIG
jgi:hypothetical protein